MSKDYHQRCLSRGLFFICKSMYMKNGREGSLEFGVQVVSKVFVFRGAYIKDLLYNSSYETSTDGERFA